MLIPLPILELCDISRATARNTNLRLHSFTDYARFDGKGVTVESPWPSVVKPLQHRIAFVSDAFAESLARDDRVYPSAYAQRKVVKTQYEKKI